MHGIVVHHLDEHTPLRDTYLSDSSSLSSISSSPSSSPCHRQQRNGKERVNESYQSLPAVLQLTLGLLGLWSPSPMSHSKANLNVHCQHTVVTMIPGDGHDDDDGIHLEKSSDGVLFDENQNKTNMVNKRKRCLISDVIAVLYLLLTCALLTYDFQTYFRNFWGKKSDILHLVSYSTYLFQVMVIPFACLFSRICYMIMGTRYRQGYPLFRGFLSKRVKILTGSRFGAKGLSWFRLVCFLAWPITNATLRLANDYRIRSNCRSHLKVYREVSHWSALIGYIFYGCFCYLIHIERVSFQCEVRQISKYARDQASAKNIDGVRRRILSFYEHYHILRRLIRCWMAFTMVVATWGLTAHLTWNYLIYSNMDVHDPHRTPDLIRSLNILVSAQKVMFFVVPCIAIGGLNLEHVWKRLKYEIAKNQRYTYKTYWRAINKYLHEINAENPREITPTLLFTAIGFYLGLKLDKGDQEFTKWNYPISCNTTEQHL
ncbi:uncharacterized protein LOC121409441 [Lytechinus variegatus]|uniref:uncharacterized protein LOC121409441 n=1 Tax=Lytechinus variegatus TaxID=7654 RepID=UPI001BB277B3|nr:uncharacterized protein LOC121409441 [Lytechinus variegatus]